MQKRLDILQIILSPWLLAAIWVVTLILLLPDFASKYMVNQVLKMPVEAYRKLCISDVLQNGKYQVVDIGENVAGRAYLKLRRPNGNTYFQANLTSNYINKTNHSNGEVIPLVENLNDSKEKEIAFPTVKEDSLFINVFDVAIEDYIIREVFVDSIGGLNAHRDFSFCWVGAEDINGDHIKELYFTIKAGFALYPRKVYRLNLMDSSIISTPPSGMNYGLPFIVPSKNGQFQVLCGTSASNNCHDGFPFPYPDNAAYAMVMDAELNLVNEPVAFKGAPSSAGFLQKKGDEYMFIYHARGDCDSTSQFFTLDMQGKYHKVRGDMDVIESTYVEGNVGLIPFLFTSSGFLEYNIQCRLVTENDFFIKNMQ